MMPAVEREREQERELRTWAVKLADAREADRRAMGRAILMLLERIEGLRAELARRPAEPVIAPEAPSPTPEAEAAAIPDAGPDEDTMVVGLRERLRAVTHRNH